MTDTDFGDKQNSAADGSWAPRFFLIWTGQAFSLLGSSLVQFALVWWLTKEIGSATVLTTATLIALLPQIVAGPFIGPLVDRWDRRKIMVLADSGIAFATVGLMVLFLTGVVQLWHVFIVLGMRSLGGAFHSPAMTASTSLLVPERHLARVNGLNQTLQGIMSIAAPPLGAVLIMVLPMYAVLTIDVATAFLAVLPLFFVRIPAPPRQAQGAVQRSSYMHDLKDGFRYVVRWPDLFGLILLAMLLNFLLVPTGALTPLLVTKVFGLGALQLAWTETALGVGTILGGMALSAWGGFTRRIVTSLVGVVGIGVGTVLTGLAPVSFFAMVIASHFMLGFMGVMANGPIGAIMQSAIDPDMQGRVFSLLGAGASAMMPLSLAIAGPLSDIFGVRMWYIAGGSVCIIVSVIAFMIPAIMNIEDNKHRQAAG